MNFIDELLLEAENAEETQRLEVDKLRADQLLMAVQVLETQMDDVNKIADEEIKLIEDYRRSEGDRLQRKRNWLSWNLEQFMRSTDLKTLKLPHGVLKLRAGRDKVEVQDVDTFLKSPDGQKFLRVIPEQYQPDLNSIHEHIKKTGEVPTGVVLIPGEVRFSLTTFKRNGNNGKDEQQHASEA